MNDEERKHQAGARLDLIQERDEARYQIARAVAQLKGLPGVEADLNIPTIQGVKSVIAQLRAYEATYPDNSVAGVAERGYIAK